MRASRSTIKDISVTVSLKVTLNDRVRICEIFGNIVNHLLFKNREGFNHSRDYFWMNMRFVGTSWLKIFLLRVRLILCDNFGLGEKKLLSWIIYYFEVIIRLPFHERNSSNRTFEYREQGRNESFCIGGLEVINFSVGIWKLWQYAVTHLRGQSTCMVNNVMCWIQVSASKLLIVIIAVIPDNSDQLTI